MIGLTCVKNNLSHSLISESREFTVNVPEAHLLDALFNCGKFSARDTDKFAKFGLTREKGRKVSAPSVRECAGHLECRLVAQPAFGDFTVFVGEVVSAYADESKFKNVWLPHVRLANHYGDDLFYAPGDQLKARLSPDAPVKK
jgi:flavin reductase (DIM6/NTAB) family NADH-FMN oxidoreductase RutF